VVRVDFAKSDQRQPEYLAINPQRVRAASVTDGGILTGTPAILAFIAQSFPRGVFAPLDDRFAFAQVQAFNSYLCSTVHVAHAHRVRGNRWADDPAAIAEMKRMAPGAVCAGFGPIEREMMLKGPWVMGETYTICDPYLFTVVEMAGGRQCRSIPAAKNDRSLQPRMIDHCNCMSERPAVVCHSAQRLRVSGFALRPCRHPSRRRRRSSN
jgi:glutathione S-transferase